jgi:sentrin-specific protease 1
MCGVTCLGTDSYKHHVARCSDQPTPTTPSSPPSLVGRIPRNPLTIGSELTFFSLPVNQLSIEELNTAYHALGDRVPRKQIMAEYIARDLNRAVYLLDKLEGSRTWAEKGLYMNVAHAVVLSLRHHLEERGCLRPRPSDWVDPYRKRSSKSAKLDELEEVREVHDQTRAFLAHQQERLDAITKGKGLPPILPLLPAALPPAKLPQPTGLRKAKKNRIARLRARKRAERLHTSEVKPADREVRFAMEDGVPSIRVTASVHDTQPSTPPRKIVIRPPSPLSLSSPEVFPSPPANWTFDRQQVMVTPPPASSTLNTPVVRVTPEGETRTVTRRPPSAMEVTPQKGDADIVAKVKRFLGKTGLRSNSTVLSAPLLPRPPRPELTPQMELTVQAGFQKPAEEVVIRRDPYVMITGETMRSLKDGQWITSDIVNYYAVLINERSSGWTGPKAYMYDTYAMIRILATGENRVNLCNSSPRIDPFAFQILILPVHVHNNHWAVVVVDNRVHSVTYLDSYRYPEGTGPVGREYEDAVQRFLYHERLRWRGNVPSAPYLIGSAEDIPKQIGGADCGIFMLQFAERASRDAAFDFSQRDIQYYRRLTAYEVLNGALTAR